MLAEAVEDKKLDARHTVEEAMSMCVARLCLRVLMPVYSRRLDAELSQVQERFASSYISMYLTLTVFYPFSSIYQGSRGMSRGVTDHTRGKLTVIS